MNAVSLVEDVARRMGVDIRRIGAHDPVLSDGHLDAGPAGFTWAGHRVVIIEEASVFRDEEEPGWWTYLLHEVSHAVWTPPGCMPDEVGSETEGQDQWEYAVVREVFPRSLWSAHLGFLQESDRTMSVFRETSPFDPGPYRRFRKVEVSNTYKDCRRLSSWRYGRRLAIASGALDPSGRPTWRHPDYDVLRSMSRGWCSLKESPLSR